MIYDNTFTAAQVAAVVVAPASGKKLLVTLAYVNGTAWLSLSGGATLLDVVNGEGSKSGLMRGAVDETIKVTCAAGATVTIQYAEV